MAAKKKDVLREQVAEFYENHRELGKTLIVRHFTFMGVSRRTCYRWRSVRPVTVLHGREKLDQEENQRNWMDLNPRPTGGGLFRAPPPSGFLAISSKSMQVSPPNLQYPLSQQFYTLC